MKKAAILFSIFVLSVSGAACAEICMGNDIIPEGRDPRRTGRVWVPAVERYGALSVARGSLVAEDGSPAVLHGVSFSWHNWWPRFYNSGAVAELVRVWKADVVRAAIGVTPPGAYLSDPEAAMRCLDAVVKAAVEEGCYVIIDWHSHETEPEAAARFFGEVSSRYGACPNVIYELFNEPVEQSWEEIKEYSSALIDVIRANDPHNVILVGCPHWDQDIHLVAADPLEGYANIMYTVHFYAATHKGHLRDRMREALDRGVPVFVSECAGMEATGDGPVNYAEWAEWEELMREYGVSWCAWSLSDKRETCSMITDGSATADGGWTDGELKEWGRFVRGRLRELSEGKTIQTR